MLLVFFGVALIVATMAVVMGVPLAYYLKRDMRWEASDKSAEAWYR